MTNPSKFSPNQRTPYLFFLLIVVGLLGLGGLLYWLIQIGAAHWIVQANQWLAVNLIDKLGYIGVFALMFIESSFVPFPSEIVIPPAGALASRDPSWNLGLVILAGILGSLAGALLNYWLAKWLGRPLLLKTIHRFGAYFRLSELGYLKAEKFFLRFGAISTFTGRLIPGIRQLISLPAGLSGMPLGPFIFFTTLGAGIWVVVLALAGYWFGSQPEALDSILKEYSKWLIAGAVLIVGAFLVYRRVVAQSAKTQ